MRLESALETHRAPAGVPVAWRAPFALERCYATERPAGESLLEIVRSLPDLPGDFLARGVICINGEVVPRALWPHVRPKPTSAALPLAVTLHYPLAGGGGSGSTAKAVGSIVAALALVVLTAGIASGLLAPVLGANFAAGAIGAKVLAGAIGIIGALAISALSPPPSADAGQAAASISDNNTDQKEAASATGNALDTGGAIPRVIGTRKVFPPYACEPFVELVNDDEYVEAVFVLNGPHLLEDITIDGVSIADADDVEYETREGWPSDSALTLTTRQGRSKFPQIALSVHKVNPDSQAQLLDASSPEDDLPVWHGVATRDSPDEVWLHLLMPNGISVNGSPSTNIGVPLRIRMRLRGDVAWINLPEVHVAESTLAQVRRALIFKFAEPPDYASIVPPSSSAGGFYYANINVPGQAVDPTTTGWDADSYFVGSGTDYLASNTIGASTVKNIGLYSNRVEFYLDPATFTPGIYEIQIMRGAAYTVSSFAPSSYAYSGTVKDFFTYSSTTTPAIPMSRANLADVMQLVRVVSIWNEHPIQAPGFALLAIRARNRQVQNVALTASGYVRDATGSPPTWSNWTTTSNPAPHYVDILSGAQNIDPLPDDLRDDDALIAWRTLCETHDWTCDAIINDMRTQDALSLLASCGYARPYQSDVYGVTVDSDRSAESPVQIFSRRNAANMRSEIAFPRAPAGLIVTYRDETSDDDQAQLIVYQRDQSVADASLLESVSYAGLVDPDKVRTRAQFDLDQATERATFYYIDTDVEAIVCRRGDLVGLQHDVLTDRAGDGYIASKQLSGSNITGITLDAELPITNEDDMHALTNMHAVTDMHEVGITTGIAIRHTDGSISTHELSNATGSSKVLTFVTAFADDATIEGFADNQDRYGCLVVAGRLDSEYRRLLVSAIATTKDLKATLTLVDEAPDLVRYSDDASP